MEYLPTFWNYYRRLLVRLAKDATPWARDNILLAFLMVVVPAVAAWSRDPAHVPDWAVIKTTGGIYLILFVVYLIYHGFRSPWKLDIDQAEKLASVTARASSLDDKLRRIEEARPNIVMHDPSAEHIQTLPVAFTPGGVMILSFAKVRFVNRPLNSSQRINANKVIAKIKFYDVNNILLLEMDGRWDDSDQPSSLPRGKSRNELLPIDFLVEQAHNLDLAFWDQASREFVAWNNDSCDFPFGRKPQHVLKGDRFKVEVRLVSADLDKTFNFQLATDEFGPTISRI